MLDGHSISPGDVFEEVSPPPGYKPMTAIVIGLHSPRWAQVRYPHSDRARTCQVASLQNPELWRRVDA